MLGKPRKIQSPEEMMRLWEEFKEDCNNRVYRKTEFSQKLGDFVTKEIPVVVSCTIIGFCKYIGLTVSAFYDTYKNDENYQEVVSRMEEDCETDVREKFEFGAIPTQLAALWMSKHGYSVKNDQNITGSIPVVISGEDELKE